VFMVLLFHGESGGWDELIIALAAFGVLWLAVKLAGRKPVEEEGAKPESGQPEDAEDLEGSEQSEEAARPPATPLG
jgi:hypothetical protein